MKTGKSCADRSVKTHSYRNNATELHLPTDNLHRLCASEEFRQLETSGLVSGVTKL